jgi:phenylpropionate dioxygenase-like ring-hydroxylating dioxygenase large terminal subunit
MQQPNNDGNAYGRSPAHPDKLLTEVGPGTPCGELLRRYWHPIAVSADLTSERPKQIRILGEDLVLFRDRSGRVGLLYERCAHRGTTLYYGKVEERGLRCCYHGWLYDVEGRCLDQPCEPQGGRARHTIRQPWYPVEERYGLVFAFMGPPAKKPVLPRYDILEDHDPDKPYEAALGGWGGTRDYAFEVVPYSWLQLQDNFMDPFHVFVLHSTFTGIQIRPEFSTMPKIDFARTENGLSHIATRRLDDGREFQRVTSVIFPNIISVAPVDGVMSQRARSISWCVPVDDTHHFQVMAGVDATRPEFEARQNNNTGRVWADMTEQERRDYPNDYEAQMGQRAISLHSEENLATSDLGVVMQRRLFQAQIDIVAKGGDPMGVSFDPAQATVHVAAENRFTTPIAAE